MNICTHFSVYLCCQFSRVYTLEWNWWIIWKLFNILNDCFSKWLPLFMFHQQCMGIWISLYPHQYLVLFDLSYPRGYEKAMAPHSSLENPMDGGAWWAAVHGVAKSRTRLSEFTFTFQFHALEKEMATHSSVLAWRIPGTGEPGGLPSMGSQSWTRLKWLSSSSSIFRSTRF